MDLLFAVLHCLVGDVLQVTVAMFTLLEVKGVATLSLLAGSFLIGLIPSWLGFRSVASHLEHSLLLSAILCFGAGVLLSTAIVHILGDVIAAIGVWGQVVFCAGFLALYFVDEAVQFWCLCWLQCERHEHSERESDATESESLLQRNRQSSSDYGSIEKRKSIGGDWQEQHHHHHHLKGRKSKNGSDLVREFPEPEKGSSKDESSHHIEDESGPASGSSFPGLDQIEKKNRSVKRLGLMFAFCVHSVLEGLAIGLQPTTTKVLLLLAAISCHKLVVTFCLGAELLSDNSSYTSYLLSLSLYSLTSGIGIVVGMFIQPSPSPVIPILQGLAGGSLLYITVGEILPRERHHKGHCPMPRPTGLLQWLSVLSGFALITSINIYTNSD